MVTAWISHEDCLQHNTGDSHPEHSARLSAIIQRMEKAKFWPVLLHSQAPLASWQSIAAVHDQSYIQSLQSRFPAGKPALPDVDTVISPGSLQAALRSAGAATHAVDLVMGKVATNAFCAIRPPGHHATRQQAMGFCLLNNAAIAIHHALHVWGLERVLLVDFDVHHGNGSEDIFANHPQVLMCGFFESPLFPHSGGLQGASNMINVPLPAGSAKPEIKHVIEHFWIDAIDRFQPQLVVVSAGFDAHEHDPLANLCLKTEDYAWLTEFLLLVAREYSQSRLVSVLEGGYHLPSLVESVHAHVQQLFLERVVQNA